MSNNPSISSLSHEFRTPLNAIIGFTGTLLMKLPGPLTADQENQLRIIQSSVRGLLELVNGLANDGGAQGEAVHNTSNRANWRPTSPVQATSRKARILLIEDDPFSRKLMAYLLSELGHVPLIALDGEQGLEMARQETPDLILCDVQLPGCDGFEVARALKQDPVLSQIPLVAVTATDSTGDNNRFPMDSFDYSLPKPIRAEALAAQLDFLLNGGAGRKSHPSLSSSTDEPRLIPTP